MKRFQLSPQVLLTGFAATLITSLGLPAAAQATSIGEVLSASPAPEQNTAEQNGVQTDTESAENPDQEVRETPVPLETPADENASATEEEDTADESTGETAGETAGEASEDTTAGEDSDETDDAPEASSTPPPLTEAQRIRRKLLVQGDLEYQAGNIAAAEALYRQAKNESWLIPQQLVTLPPEAFSDEAQLAPAAGVYWREAQSGIANDRLSQAMVALALLTTEYPAFVPGHIAYANLLQANERPDEASAVLERALTRYPAQSELLLAQVELMMTQKQWLEASIASRQFVTLNGDHEAAQAQAQLAQENLARFQRETRSEIRNDAIANIFTGVLGYAFTGSIFGPLTAASSAFLLLQGENSVGAQYANQVQQQLPMLEQPEALGYVRQLGNRLAAVTGRDDLDYEFFVILDPDLNAFALPGGKIFVNAGAILQTRSEAELAGLLAHELSHSVLSHGFQIATEGNLGSSLTQYLPYGGLINNIFLSGYSRQMERQADIVGTQILAAGGYAADGLHNVMVTLNEQAENTPRALSWLSSHPNSGDRVTYLQNLVEAGGYNRYAYEGVVSHEEIQALVARELAAYEARQNPDKKDPSEQSEEETAPETDTRPSEGQDDSADSPPEGTSEGNPSADSLENSPGDTDADEAIAPE